MLDSRLKKFDSYNQLQLIHDRYVPQQPRNMSIEADLELVGARTTFSCATVYVKRLPPVMK